MNKTLLIRRMTASDVDRVTDIAVRCFSNPWTKEDYIYSLESEHDLGLVAVCDNKVVGFCIMRMSIDSADITDVAVAPEARRKGIGSMLIASLLTEGKSRGITGYMLEVRISNEAAIDLYKKNGFEKTGIRKNYYKSPVEDALLMNADIY